MVKVGDNWVKIYLRIGQGIPFTRIIFPVIREIIQKTNQREEKSGIDK